MDNFGRDVSRVIGFVIPIFSCSDIAQVWSWPLVRARLFVLHALTSRGIYRAFLNSLFLWSPPLTLSNLWLSYTIMKTKNSVARKLVLTLVTSDDLYLFVLGFTFRRRWRDFPLVRGGWSTTHNRGRE